MKNRTKRLLTVLVSLVLIIGAMSVSALAADKIASGKCGDDVAWTLTDDGTLKISGIGEMYDYESDSTPW